MYYWIRRRHLNLADAEFRASMLLPAYTSFEYPQEGERSGASDLVGQEMTQLKIRSYSFSSWSVVVQWLGHRTWNLRVVSSVVTGSPH